MKKCSICKNIYSTQLRDHCPTCGAYTVGRKHYVISEEGDQVYNFVKAYGARLTSIKGIPGPGFNTQTCDQEVG